MQDSSDRHPVRQLPRLDDTLPAQTLNIAINSPRFNTPSIEIFAKALGLTPDPSHHGGAPPRTPAREKA